MKKQFLLLGAAVIFGFAACNDSGTNSTTTTDSTANTTATTPPAITRGTEIANFSTRTFMDLKTNKPIKLHWDTVHYYYVDETGNQPYFYYDPAAHDTFDYWGRRLNDYLIYENNDYRIDEARMPAMDMSSTTIDTSASSMSTSGDSKMKAKDDKYKEKTDTSKLKVKDDKMKSKSK